MSFSKPNSFPDLPVSLLKKGGSSVHTVAFKRVWTPTWKLHYLRFIKLSMATSVVFLSCYSYFEEKLNTKCVIESFTVT